MTEHFTYQGFAFTMEIVDDYDHEPPWDDGDGRGIVTDWIDKTRKEPGWRLLREDRGGSRFFDWAGTIAKATKEGWGLGKEEEQVLAQKLGRRPTRKQIIAAAVEREFEFMRGWCNDEWRYVGVTVTANFDSDGSNGGESDSVWGIESCSTDYIEEVRDELADQLLPITRFEREMRKAAELT